MNALIARVNSSDLHVLGSPANNFGLQEPGLNREIPFGIKWVRPGGGFELGHQFELTVKIDVNGENEHDIYKHVKDACPGTLATIGSPSGMYWSPVKQSDITWNFEKFLIDRNGIVRKRYNPAFSGELMYNDVMDLLNEEPAQKETPK